jgi:hypothetical protein
MEGIRISSRRAWISYCLDSSISRPWLVICTPGLRILCAGLLIIELWVSSIAFLRQPGMSQVYGLDSIDSV